jgi:hypothetical protein
MASIDLDTSATKYEAVANATLTDDIFNGAVG